MTRYVAFLRAINVGGRVVKMVQLRALLASIPLANVSTFIASGNAIFDAKEPPGRLESAIEAKLKFGLGYEVTTMVRSTTELVRIIEHVDAAKLQPGGDVTLYVGLLKTAPSQAIARAVAAMSNDVDAVTVAGRELYWRCSKSFSESTIAGPKLDKVLKVPVTLRNFNTIQRIAALIGSRL